MPAPRATALALAAAALLLAAPGAHARTTLVSVPGEFSEIEADWHLPLAVTDRGRVGFLTSLSFGQGAVGIAAPGATAAAIAPFPGVLIDVSAAVFDPDGTLVAAGTVDTEEVAANPDDDKSEGCCLRPYLVRWPGPGTTPRAFAPPPDRHRYFETGALAIDRQGTIFLAAGHPSDYDDPDAMLVRIPRAGPVAWRDVPVLEEDSSSYRLRVPDDGVGVTAVTDDDDRPHRLTADARGWHATARPPRRRPHEGQPLLGPGGRTVRVALRAGVLWLVREGHRRDVAVGRAAGHRRPRLRFPVAAEADAIGRDGTVAVAWTRGDAVLLRTIGPDGRRRPERRLGRIRRGSGNAEIMAAVDDQGHAHVLFTAPGGRVVAVGPHGRRVFGTGAVTIRPAGIALSPGGAEALAVATPTRRLIAVRPAGR